MYSFTYIFLYLCYSLSNDVIIAPITALAFIFERIGIVSPPTKLSITYYTFIFSWLFHSSINPSHKPNVRTPKYNTPSNVHLTFSFLNKLIFLIFIFNFSCCHIIYILYPPLTPVFDHLPLGETFTSEVWRFT